jgi:hypothetical protein
VKEAPLGETPLPNPLTRAGSADEFGKPGTAARSYPAIALVNALTGRIVGQTVHGVGEVSTQSSSPTRNAGRGHLPMRHQPLMCIIASSFTATHVEDGHFRREPF